MAVNKNNSGFSLIELLVVTALMGLLSVALVSVFLATVRGSNRARLEAELRAQGDSVTTSLERNLRNAIDWQNCTGASTIVYSLRGETSPHTYDFSAPTIRLDGANLISGNVALLSRTLTCGQSGGGYSRYVVAVFRLEGRRAGEVITEDFTARVAMRNRD